MRRYFFTVIFILFFLTLRASLDDFDDDNDLNDELDHESVFKSEIEDFKELPPDEAKAKLKKLIKSIDKNSDGKISKTELKQWTLDSLKNNDQKDAKNHFEDNDDNRDGFLTFYEYLKRSYGYDKDELEDLKKEESTESRKFLKTINEDFEKFNLTDLNKDGKLTLEEYAAFRHPSKYDHMNAFETKLHMNHFDKNSDGLISLEEFAGQSKGEELEAERVHFNHFDKNKDGKLDLQEVTEWSSPGYDKTADEETEHLFEQSDLNRDKNLTEDEIINDYETWLSSHATDYGDHLRNIKDEL